MEGGGGGHVYLYYSGPRLSRVGLEKEVSQWAQQFMPQNSDFPFQPTEPKRLSQQDLWVGEGLAEVEVKETDRASCSVPLSCIYFWRVKGYKSMWLTEAD